MSIFTQPAAAVRRFSEEEQSLSLHILLPHSPLHRTYLQDLRTCWVHVHAVYFNRATSAMFQLHIRQLLGLVSSPVMQRGRRISMCSCFFCLVCTVPDMTFCSLVQQLHQTRRVSGQCKFTSNVFEV